MSSLLLSCCCWGTLHLNLLRVTSYRALHSLLLLVELSHLDIAVNSSSSHTTYAHTAHPHTHSSAKGVCESAHTPCPTYTPPAWTPGVFTLLATQLCTTNSTPNSLHRQHPHTALAVGRHQHIAALLPTQRTHKRTLRTTHTCCRCCCCCASSARPSSPFAPCPSPSPPAAVAAAASPRAQEAPQTGLCQALMVHEHLIRL